MEVVPSATVIDLPERGGNRDLDGPTANLLLTSSSFRELLEAKIVTARFLGSGGVRLMGNGYIGESTHGPIRLRLVEKVQGAAELLLGMAGDDEFHLKNQERLTTAPGDLLRLIIARFAKQVSEYCSSGRGFDYRDRINISSRQAGRLMIPATIRLWASGRRNLLACCRPEQSRDTPFNRAIYSGLQEAEILSSAAKASPATVMAIRAMASIFQHDNTVGKQISRESKRANIEQLIQRENNTVRATMLRTASLLLSREGIERNNYRTGVSPIAWFISLHGLFEEAVRRSLRRAAEPWAVVSNAKKFDTRIHLFDPDLYQLNPDLVVRPIDGIILIGDVKYKNLGSEVPDEDDIYQLVVHATAFDANLAFLIYCGDAYAERYIGRAASGLEVVLFSVALSGFTEHISVVAGRLKQLSARPTSSHNGDEPTIKGLRRYSPR